MCGVGHNDLAAAALFPRCADDFDRALKIGQGATQRDPGADAPGGDQVVAAGVADLRQRVILGEESDDRLATAVGGDKGGVETRRRRARR